jgi:bacterioferritin (cytochrome b1)
VPVTREMLLTELQDLLRLTAFEQTIATVRRTQARTTPLAQELAANAEKAAERLRLLKVAVGQVGGVPDVVGAGLGRMGAFLTTQLNQVQTLQGALMGDLTLEHQLRERTRYARTLAQSLGETSLLPVLDRLETAHSATIEWLEARLTELGRTGSSALAATPMQVAVGAVRRYAGYPFGAAADGINRATGLLGKLGRKAQPKQAAEAVKDAVTEVALGTVVAAGEAVEEAPEKVIDLINAAADPVAEAAEMTEEVLEATGGADVEEGRPPFAGYDRLTGDRVMGHVNDTEDVEELRTLLAYEQAHKARKGVLAAAQERLTALSSSV